MAETTVFEPGGYRYVRGRFQYSGGVAAERGFVIERARFARPVPLDEGFRRIETYLGACGRPLTAFWSQVYTVHAIHGFLANAVIRRVAAPDGVTWTYARPPVEGLAFEMDVRGVPVERVVG